MAAPEFPFQQPLIQESPNLGNMTIGSVGRSLFVTFGWVTIGGVETEGFTLWRVTDAAAVEMRSVAAPGLSVYGHAENDSGVIAFWGVLGTDYVAARVKADLSYDIFTLPHTYGVEGMWVSGDGAEIVLKYGEWNATNNDIDIHLYAYSMTGTPTWDFVINTSESLMPPYYVKRNGYVAGVPRAGRVLWVNTTVTTCSTPVSGSVMTGSGSWPDIHWTITGTMPDPLPLPIAAMQVRFNVTWSGRSEMGWSWDHPYPSYETGVQTPYVNGVEATPHNLNVGWAPDVFYVRNWVSADVTPLAAGAAFSYDLTIVPFAGPDWGEWWTAYEFYAYGQHGGGSINIDWDLSEFGGERIELRSGTGTVLDAIPIPTEFSGLWAPSGQQYDYARWIHSGSNTLTAFAVYGAGGGGT